MRDRILNTDNLGANGDDFYNLLMAAHKELSEAQSHALNARLVLMMANEIGDLERLNSLISLAREFNNE